MRIGGVFILLSLLVLVLPVSAQEKNRRSKPDFSGNWLLTKSEDVVDKLFGPKAEPKEQDVRKTFHLKIEHADPELKLIDVVTTENLGADGKASNKTVALGDTRVFYTGRHGDSKQNAGTAKWDGNAIVIGIVDEKNRTMSTIKLSLSRNQTELTVTTMVFAMKYDSVSRQEYVVGMPMGTGKKIYVKD